MNFSWRESKRKSNLNKHGFDFADAERVFNGPTFTVEDARDYDGEQRYSAWVSGHKHRDDQPHGNRKRNSHHLHAKGGVP